MRKRICRRPSPSMGVALLALFVALGGTTYAATGGSFILGQSNTAGNTSDLTSGVTTGPTLNAVNTGGRSAARFNVDAGIQPFSVNNSTKITGLNSDLLDGLDSAGFVQTGAAAGGDLTGPFSNLQLKAGALTGTDVLNSSLTGLDIAPDSLTGADVTESTLSVAGMGCQSGKVLGFARVKGAAGMPASYTNSSTWSDTRNNCAGGTIVVRRSAKGVFFVRFEGLNARLALAISNSDGFGVQSTASDNVLSVNRITGGSDIGAFRVEVEDINSGGSDPEDNWFTIVVF